MVSVLKFNPLEIVKIPNVNCVEMMSRNVKCALRGLRIKMGFVSLIKAMLF